MLPKTITHYWCEYRLLKFKGTNKDVILAYVDHIGNILRSAIGKKRSTQTAEEQLMIWLRKRRNTGK